MNRIILLGRLTRDPEVRYTQTGKVVCQFTLAVDRPFANQDGQREADFIPVVIWGKQAETCGNSLTKGQRVLVEGRLQIRSYDAKDGSKRYVTEVIAKFENLFNVNGGSVEKTDRWGKNRLAYEIQDLNEGIYVLVTFQADAAVVKELDRVMRITDEVLRHMIIRKGE